MIRYNPFLLLAAGVVGMAGAIAIAYHDPTTLAGVEASMKKYPATYKAGLEVVKTVLLIVAALTGLGQWYNEQRWRRRTTVLDRVKGFLDTPGTFNAQLMLQGRNVRVPLWDRAVSGNPYTLVTPDEVATALLPERRGAWPQSDRHDAIRNSFNDYLGRLADIELYVSQAGVLTNNDVRHLSRRFHQDLHRLVRRAPETGVALWQYMNEYGHDDVIAFIGRAEKHAFRLSNITPVWRLCRIREVRKLCREWGTWSNWSKWWRWRGHKAPQLAEVMHSARSKIVNQRRSASAHRKAAHRARTAGTPTGALIQQPRH